MKTLFLSLAFAIGFASLNAQVGINTSDPQATLDVVSTEKGILIPRMTLAQATDAGTTHVHSEIVYITDGDGITDSPTKTAGFYFYSKPGSAAGVWTPLVSETTVNIAGNIPVMDTSTRDAASWDPGAVILNSDHQYPNYYLNSTEGWWEPNDGHVQIISGAGGVKPTTTNFDASGPNDPPTRWVVQYQTPLMYAAIPTSTYPKNMNIKPDLSNWNDNYIYKNVTGVPENISHRFVENLWVGQMNRWRLQFSYELEGTVTFAYLSVVLENPDSGFKLSRQVVLPKKTTGIGYFDVELSAVSDYVSLPAPLGTHANNGYIIYVENNTGALIKQITLESVTRISEFTTYKYPNYQP